MADSKQDTPERLFSISAVVCTFLACISLAVALATEQWQTTVVDRSGLMKIIPFKPELRHTINSNELYFDRIRGLFYRCGTTVGLHGVITRNSCVQDIAFQHSPVLDFQQKNSTETDYLLTTLKMRNNLVICVTALLLIAELLTLITGLIGIAAITKRHRSLYTAAMSIAFFSTLFAGTSMAMFHGIDYLENTKLTIYIFPATMRTDPEYNELRSHTVTSLSYSYYLGWLTVIFSCASAILYLQTRIILAKQKAHPEDESSPSFIMSSSTASLFSAASKIKKKRKKSESFVDSMDTIHSAYDMMNKGKSGDSSEQGSSQSPTSDDWNPFDELPSDDPIRA